jgi:pilus assembly protein Flp/PilA
MIEYFTKIRATRREEGASAVEYGLMVAAIAAIIVIAVFAIGNIVGGAFEDTCTTMADEDADATTLAAGCQ